MPIPRVIQNLALIGFMGTGKSSVGRLVAAGLRYDFVDTDHLLEQRAGRSITEIFQQDGEAAFRQMERALVQEMAGWKNTVIATGGGLGADATNLELLKQHALVVCLWASPEGIRQRLRHQTHRPLLLDTDPLEKIRELLAQRTAVYKQADVLVNTELRSAREVADHVLHQFHNACSPSPPTRLPAGESSNPG